MKRKHPQSNRALSRDEVYTPIAAYEQIMRAHFTPALLSNSKAKILIPAAGIGSDIKALLSILQAHGHSEEQALAMITANELEKDSCKQLKEQFPNLNLIEGPF